MNNVYGFKTISDALLCGCGSVGPGAAASLGLAFILWNYATSARVSLKGPLAALAGLAGGRFLFFSNLISGHLGLTILNSYLILAGGLALIWLASKRARYVQAAAAWSGGPVPSRLFWPYGFLFGWALASLSRPGLDIFGLNLIIFGFKGQGWPLWIFWILGNMVILNLVLIIILAAHSALRNLAAEYVKYRVEQVLAVFMALAGLGLLLKSVNLW